MLYWLEQRYNIYNQNMTAANMTAAGISSADQANIQSFVNDLARIAVFMTGTMPATAPDVRVDINNITGVV